MKRVNDMTDKEIKKHYYYLINQSRAFYSEKMKVESFLDSPLLMCCFMVLWLWMGLTFLLFIIGVPDIALPLLFMGGIPLGILLLTTRYFKGVRKEKHRIMDYYDNQIISFRNEIENRGRTFPDYPFLDSEVHYLDFEYTGTVVDDERLR